MLQLFIGNPGSRQPRKRRRAHSGRMLFHPFISMPGALDRRRRPIVLSTLLHLTLLGGWMAPARHARYATVPREREVIEYTELAASRPHTSVATVRRRSRPKPLLAIERPPQLTSVDLSFAMDIAVPPVLLPEPELPRLTDSLFTDGRGASPFASAANLARDPGGNGAAMDSVVFVASAVDRIAQPLDGNPKPAYPIELLNRMQVSGFAAHFVVDTTGRIDMATVEIPPSVDRLFARSVRDALARWHFYPAEVRGHRVKQLMEQPFEFRIVSGRSM